ITEYDKDARLILCVFARKHEKQNRQLLLLIPSGKEADTPLTQTVLTAIDSFAHRLNRDRNDLDILQTTKFSTRNTVTAKALLIDLIF
ncbi:MAG: hypothetical protein LBQ50_12590, partial [Planctomycetaceae bacterium]|nr:hypothetical protein [Planctomycetaceae bacterium]